MLASCIFNDVIYEVDRQDKKYWLYLGKKSY